MINIYFILETIQNLLFRFINWKKCIVKTTLTIERGTLYSNILFLFLKMANLWEIKKYSIIKRFSGTTKKREELFNLEKVNFYCYYKQYGVRMDWETEQSTKNLHDTRWWGRFRYILQKKFSLSLSLSHLKEFSNYIVFIWKNSQSELHIREVSAEICIEFPKIGYTFNFKMDVEYEFHFQSVECAWTLHCTSKPRCRKYPCNCCCFFSSFHWS